MQTARITWIAGSLILAGSLFLGSCALTDPKPQQFRTFLLPPAPRPSSVVDEPVPEPPRISAAYYANEMPAVTASVPDVPRPSDADFLLKKANDRFAAGKQAFQVGRVEDARKEFNRALEILLGAPENVPDRARIERSLEDMVETIYRYDVDQSGGAADEVSYDKSPHDDLVEMTFSVEPSLRSKVREQIRATTSQLPLEESDAVIGAINYFSSERGKKIIAAGLRRQGRYKSLIERVLAEEGLPQELIFVAQAESGFSPHAVSNKLCVGLWQFAKFRGNEYGLQQTPATDDRMDPEKATRAAARHLHDLYEHFGDWYLALAAYDCGPACIDHAVMRTGYADFWTLRRLNVLPKETMNYVPAILAMTIMAKNAKDYGLDNVEPDRGLEFDTLELQSPTHLALIADAVERPLSELKELNPALLRSVAPAGMTIHVPKGTLPAVEAAFAVVPANRRDSWRLHRVQYGDSVAALAKRYKATPAAISSANHDEFPGAGEWAAIPAGYPGDRVPVARRQTAKPAGKQAARPAARQTVAKAKVPLHKKAAPVAATHKSPAKPVAHRAQASGAPAS